MRQIFFGVVAEGFEDIYFGKRERTRKKKDVEDCKRERKTKMARLKVLLRKENSIFLWRKVQKDSYICQKS